MERLRPKQILKDIGREFPQAWQQVRGFRADKGKTLPNWPDWCYIPIAAGMAIATQGDNTRVYQSSFSKLSPAVITAAAAWRVSQGVYRFDADLYNALISQPLDGNVPSETLTRLPEYCVFIETIGATFQDAQVVGFWAHLESDANDGRMELRFVLMCEDGDNIPISIHLGNWTLEDGLSRMQKESEKQAGFKFPKNDFIKDITPLVQLVIYLCAENLDMPRVPSHPSTRVRASGAIDAPKEPRTWNVGERIGSAIRKYKNQEVLSEVDKNSDKFSTHTSPRPHVRRAHWATYWTGTKMDKQIPIIKWLPPIPVGINDNEEPIVIHKVK